MVLEIRTPSQEIPPEALSGGICILPVDPVVLPDGSRELIVHCADRISPSEPDFIILNAGRISFYLISFAH